MSLDEKILEAALTAAFEAAQQLPVGKRSWTSKEIAIATAAATAAVAKTLEVEDAAAA